MMYIWMVGWMEECQCVCMYCMYICMNVNMFVCMYDDDDDYDVIYNDDR